MDNKIRVIICEVGKAARIAEIEDKLETMQGIVGGLIQEFMPWKDEVAVILNEEGKLHGLPLNRALLSEEGEIIDIFAGDFFLCYAPYESERFLSLPPELEKKYFDMFEKPERFVMTDESLTAVKVDPKDYFERKENLWRR